MLSNDLAALSIGFRIVGLAVMVSTAARATVNAEQAASIFQEAKVICDRDRGALWGRSLCGPILLVDYRDRGVAANQADHNRVLRPSGGVFVGTLPQDALIANTPVEWSGTRWTELVWPLEFKGGGGGDEPDLASRRHVMLAHEMFHRIQPGLRLTRPEADNRHLDTLDGRYLLQLEWRALATALTAATPSSRRSAISDALLFRHERYKLFPDATAEEYALEINEGIPEYTGVKLGLTTSAARTPYAVYDLSAFVDAPSFVRSFAYATGPAYGLLLDDADPAWRREIGSGRRLDQLLSTPWGLVTPDASDLAAREAVYDDGSLRAREVKRDRDRQSRLATLKARLVDGPTVTFPLRHAGFQFNPQTLIPLGGLGTVYPTMRLTSAWGALEVESGGVLLANDKSAAAVSAVGIQPDRLRGDGWRLKLTSGWALRPSPRKGDWVVVEARGSR